MRTLIIFSQGIYDKTLTILRVLLDFSHYSIQLHPKEFPIIDPNDSPRDIDVVTAIRMNRTNSRFADSYGHFREARFTQIKHHWW